MRLRLAAEADVPALAAIMDRAIAALQQDFLSAAEIAASRRVMGIDRQLIADGSYFVVECDGRIAGCGGWSARATLYGGDHSPGRDARRLDPVSEPARVRAMYTDPDFARRGVGRTVLAACEAAARDAGFARVELMATLSGQVLYAACGYLAIEAIHDTTGAVPVPLVRMAKALA